MHAEQVFGVFPNEMAEVRWSWVSAPFGQVMSRQMPSVNCLLGFLRGAKAGAVRMFRDDFRCRWDLEFALLTNLYHVPRERRFIIESVPLYDWGLFCVSLSSSTLQKTSSHQSTDPVRQSFPAPLLTCSGQSHSPFSPGSVSSSLAVLLSSDNQIGIERMKLKTRPCSRLRDVLRQSEEVEITAAPTATTCLHLNTNSVFELRHCNSIGRIPRYDPSLRHGIYCYASLHHSERQRDACS